MHAKLKQSAGMHETLNGGTAGRRDSTLDGEGDEIRPTICSICNPHSHCGIDAHVRHGKIVKVEGTRSNPRSGGTLCSKGAASRQYLYNRDRISTPLVRKGPKGSGDFESVSWEKALDLVAERLNGIKRESGPESVAFYAGYSKWMRPFLKRLSYSFGSPNYCNESSVCFAATKMASLLNFGCMGKPQLEKTRCLLVWSSNPFYTNTSSIRNLLNAREKGLKIIEVGPLVTPLTARADIHLRLRPGTSGALAMGLAHVILAEGLYDREFTEKWTLGFDAYREYAAGFTPRRTFEITQVPEDLVVEAARLFAKTKPAAILSGASPTVHHTNGVQNHRAILALLGLTANFDREGGNYVVPPAWLHAANGLKTRQAEYETPRPVAGMAPQMSQRRFPVWTRLIGEAQAMELPHRIQNPDPYPIRAVTAFGMNHRMWPGSEVMKKSLLELDFFVNVDIFMTDTCRLADVVLPACTSFERSELKFYNEDFIIWTTPVIPPLCQSRPDTEIIFELAARIAPDDELMQKGYEANVDWILAPTGFTVEALRKHSSGYRVENIQKPPYLKYSTAGFPTPSGKMEFASTILEAAGFDALPVYREPACSPVSTPDLASRFPLILTTGARLPMYVHSRTFRLPWTKRLHPDPTLDMHAADAAERGISQGDRVALSTPRNSIEVSANITRIVPPGTVSIYHGYSDPEVNTLFDPDYLDPISGYPGFKSMLCEVRKSNGPAGSEA